MEAAGLTTEVGRVVGRLRRQPEAHSQVGAAARETAGVLGTVPSQYRDACFWGTAGNCCGGSTPPWFAYSESDGRLEWEGAVDRKLSSSFPHPPATI